MSKGRFQKKARRTGLKVVLAILGIIAVCGLGGVAYANSTLNDMLGEVNHVEVAKTVYDKPAQETEVPGQTETIPQTEPAGAEEKQPEVVYSPEDFTNFLVVCKPVWENDVGVVTDTMILCTLNNRSRTVTMTQLLPDAYVQTRDYKGLAATQVPLGTVYGLGSNYGGKAGSMELMNQTLYDNFGIEIDHNFEFDFELFAKVVSRIDGVNIELSNEEAAYLSEKTGKGIQAGDQYMNGELALAYVRMWNEEKTTGISSIGCQRKLVMSILNKIKGQYVGDLGNIAKDMMPMVTTSMTNGEMREWLLDMLSLLRYLSVEKADACPANYQAETVLNAKGDEITVLTFDVAEVTKVMRELTKGEKN